jgi:hypothetical protein
MKRYILVLIIILLNTRCFSQGSLTSISNYYSSKSSLLPADKIYLHLDRNLYHPGDTIRFQAYIKDRQTGVFETKSISLHCLLATFAGATVDSARFRIINSSASGWLKIKDDQQTGDYSVLAFTSMMMNYGPEYIFSAPVRIDRLRPGQPVIQKPAANNDMQASSPLLSQPSVDLKFLPEGGTFIAGIKQRVAFNATTSTGKTLGVTGSLVDQNGEKIVSLRSGKYGPGLFEMTPKPGITYSVILDGELFSGMRWPFPSAAEEGVSLCVGNNEEGILDINVTGRNVHGKKYILTITMNEVLVLSGEVKTDSTAVFTINTDELPTGTAYITLFDNELNPVAERLVFVNGWRKLNFEVATEKTAYARGEETELVINALDFEGDRIPAAISVAVIDSASGFYSTSPLRDIESSMLFENEFYNNLPLKIRMEGLCNIDDENIDLLMMTYGWRKFSIRDLRDNDLIREIKDYDHIKINSTAPPKKARDEIRIITLEGSEILSLRSGSNNISFLKFDTLGPGARQIMIMPDANSVKNVYPLSVEFPDAKDFARKAKSSTVPAQDMTIDIPLVKRAETDFGLDSAIMIESITIKGSKEPLKEKYNKYQIQYRNTSPYTLTSKEFKTALNFEDILFRMHPYKIDTKNKRVFLGLRTGRIETPALIVVDDNPLWDVPDASVSRWLSNYSQIADMPASDISSVTMVKGQQGYAFYGEAAIGGIVFVVTNGKAMRDGSYEEPEPAGTQQKNDLIRPLRIYRSEIEYYIPKKEEVATNPEYQFRPTLLWQNEIILDGKNPARIRFPNHMIRGTVMVFINGVSADNIPGSGFYRYTVK